MAGEAGVAVIVWLGCAILLFEPTRTPRCFNSVEYPVSRPVQYRRKDLGDVPSVPRMPSAMRHCSISKAGLERVGAKGVRKDALDSDSLNLHDLLSHASKSPSTRGLCSGPTSHS